MFSKIKMKSSTNNYWESLNALKDVISSADAVIIGAGSGLSTAAGYIYAGQRFDTYFKDFANKYGIQDMYSGGFYPFVTQKEKWAWWSRHIWVNRYAPIPKDTYSKLAKIVKDKDYFVLTTNVDHCFQRAGFAKDKLFYTQGDYGLLQCSIPCHHDTYDNEELMKEMVLAQGFKIEANGQLVIPDGATIKMTIPENLVPHCPRCSQVLTTNLRADDRFVQDHGWHKASRQFVDFMEKYNDKKIVFWEIGVGMNTPVIIKYPFWKFTSRNNQATYACLNQEVYVPQEIEDHSICLNFDINQVIQDL